MKPSPCRGQQGMPVYSAGPPMADGVIKLASNENAWGASPLAIRAFVDAAPNLHRYPDPEYPRLRAALAERVGTVVSRIAMGAGSEQLITNLMAAYAGPQDEVLVSRYGFALFRIAARMGNANVVMAPESDLCTDVDAMLAAVTPRTRVVAVATPNNPTGTALSFHQVERLRNGLPEGVLLLLDLAYAEFGPPGAVATAHRLADSRDDTVVLRTFSKAHGLASARVGWAHAAESVLAPIRRLRPPFPIASAGSAAALASLSDTTWLRNAVKAVVTERECLRGQLMERGLRCPRSYTNFLYVDFGTETRAQTVLQACKERGVLLRPLGMYGLEQSLRMTVGTPAENQHLLAQLGESGMHHV